MSVHKRIPRRAGCAVLCVATLLAALSVWRARDAFTPFVPQAPPQRALGDFDGDGRVDTALIQDGAGVRRISVQLSGSPSAVRLEAPVTGVIERDIDHDGDLDLVAATPSGDVLIWLNDGHGRFTKRQAASKTLGLFSEPMLLQTVWPESMAVNLRSLLRPSPARGDTAVIVTPVRAPAADVAYDARCPVLPALRAPPVSFV
jgi:hypothetical protein